MFKTIINAWKVKDLRTKMLYTLLPIVVYCLGSFIPVHGIDAAARGSMDSQYDLIHFLEMY